MFLFLSFFLIFFACAFLPFYYYYHTKKTTMEDSSRVAFVSFVLCRECSKNTRRFLEINTYTNIQLCDMCDKRANTLKEMKDNNSELAIQSIQKKQHTVSISFYSKLFNVFLSLLVAFAMYLLLVLVFTSMYIYIHQLDPEAVKCLIINPMIRHLLTSWF